MTIRNKTLLIVGLTMAGLIVVLYALVQSLMANSFRGLETRDTGDRLTRVAQAIDHQLSNMSDTTYDWAAWDDTYEFIEDGNSEYIDSNLVPETFPTLKIDLMLYFDASGDLVWGKEYDAEEEELAPVSRDLIEQFSSGSVLLNHPDEESYIAGVLMLPEDVLFVASRPILTSQDEGPIRGSLIMARNVSPDVVDGLGQLAHESVGVRRLNDPNMSHDFKAAFAALSEGAPTFIQPLDQDTIAGYEVRNDVHGDPALVLRVDHPRDILAQGQTSTRYLLACLLAVGLVSVLASWALLDRQVLSRLSRMARDVTAIGEGRDPSARVSDGGSDELSEVARAINGMLGELDESQRQTKASLAEKELLLKEIHHRIKNNLQFVSSLLYLQSRAAQGVNSEEEIQNIFLESQSRIKAMSFVHEELYQSDDLARINLADYVNSLAEHLLKLYGSSADPVQITTETESVFLGIDSAVPCGLILNELLTNAMKHAFPNGTNGEIRVELRQVDSAKASEVILAVNDNGVGFQKGFDPRSMQSLGLQLVTTLVEQLGGSMEFNGSDGARVEVSFHFDEK